jgi:hypothetical protein
LRVLDVNELSGWLVFEAEKLSCGPTEQIVNVLLSESISGFQQFHRIGKSPIRVRIVATDHESAGANAFHDLGQSGIIGAEGEVKIVEALLRSPC